MIQTWAIALTILKGYKKGVYMLDVCHIHINVILLFGS